MKDSDIPSVRRRDILKVTGGVGIAATAGCLNTGGGGGKKGTYEIGMVDSRSGSLSAFGQRNKRGQELALKAVNDVGVKDGKLKISVEDSQSTQQGGVSAAQKLVNQNGVPLMVGAVGSGVSIAIHESVISNSSVVQISQNSTSPNLRDYPDLLRMCPNGDTQAEALADMITEDGYDSVAITWINNDYGQGIMESFKNAYDGDIAYNQSHDQGKSSYSNVITSMAQADAGAWLFVTYQPEFTTMAQEAYDQGATDKADWYGGDSVKGPKVLKGAPKGSLEGMKVVTPSAALDQDNYKSFASDFKSKYGSEPTAWSAYTYDAIVTGALATQAAKTFSGNSLMKVVRDVTRPGGKKATSYKAAHDILADGGSAKDVNYEGVSGPIDLDEKGDPKAYLQIFTVKDHSYSSTGFTAA
ncbi:MAG: ABC transporter substrate-binding protein [Halorientalis sp.]